MLKVFFSNRFEILCATFLAQIKSDGSRGVYPALTPQQVIIPSVAISRTLQRAIADREGVCANIEFAYLGQWLWRQIARFLPVSAQSPFTPDILVWHVFDALRDPEFAGKHERLALYLQQADERMRFDLAQRIAGLFEQYITYRPDQLARWTATNPPQSSQSARRAIADEAWQAELWQRIAQRTGAIAEHPAHTFIKLFEACSPSELLAKGLPGTVSLFCLPSLPPLSLQMLRKLSAQMEVNLYLLNPCAEYWYEIVDPKRLSLLQSRDAAAHHEIGNRLLASWGKQTQAQVDSLFSDEAAAEVFVTDFSSALNTTLLQQVQGEILTLTEPQRTGTWRARETPTGTVDRSIEIHVCHSLTRELEVLHDQILALFSQINPPALQDIVVVMPDLEAAAPQIEAVFGAAPAALQIPYAISGLPAARENRVAQALDRLIALTLGRHSASAVFDFLQLPVVAERFGLDAQQLALIRRWIAQCGMHWSLDGDECQDLDLPDRSHHGFAQGLDRLMLGYAIGDMESQLIETGVTAGSTAGSTAASTVLPLFAGLLACPLAQPEEAFTLARFWGFIQKLSDLRKVWRTALTAPVWRAELLRAIEQFTAPIDTWSLDNRLTIAAVDALVRGIAQAGLETALPLAVVRAALTDQLALTAPGGVPTGRVTFSTIGSLRGLPFRFVFAIGLNDGAFPSRNKPLEFDLIARFPRRGDRQRALDERNQFLDLLLSARERFVLSYTGRSIRDNSPKPPSILVAELIDYLGPAAAIIEHPLQPFSQDYFTHPLTDCRKSSHRQDFAQALRARERAEPTRPTGQVHGALVTDDVAPVADESQGESQGAWEDAALPFFETPLPAPTAAERVIDLRELIQFFQSPARALLQARLKINLWDPEQEILDQEPLGSEPRARRALSRRLLGVALKGADPTTLQWLAQAGVELPVGPIGRVVRAEALQSVDRFVVPLLTTSTAPRVTAVHSVQIALAGEQWTIQASLAMPLGLERLGWRYDQIRSRDYLQAWITHLFLGALAPARQPSPAAEPTDEITRWYGQNDHFQLRALAQPRQQVAIGHLQELLQWYRIGMVQPLPFFPDSAWELMRPGGSPQKARQRWTGSAPIKSGERDNPYYQLAFRGHPDPLDSAFEKCAKQIFAPLLDHLLVTENQWPVAGQALPQGSNP